MLMPAFERWHSGKFASGAAGTSFAGRISWANPNPAVPDAHLSLSCSRHRNNQARESWICNSLKPNLPQTFFAPLVRGAHDGKSRIDFTGHHLVAHGARGRDLECRFRARGRELPRRAERPGAAG